MELLLLAAKEAVLLPGDRVVHIREPPQAKLQANWQLMNDTLEPAPVQLCARDVVFANQVDV